MTPAERDRARATAQVQIDHHRATPLVSQANKDGCRCTDCQNARAILRYVPAGVVPPSLLSATAERRDDGQWVIDFDHGQCTPESARRIAAEFYAAADAAEES